MCRDIVALYNCGPYGQVLILLYVYSGFHVYIQSYNYELQDICRRLLLQFLWAAGVLSWQPHIQWSAHEKLRADKRET